MMGRAVRATKSPPTGGLPSGWPLRAGMVPQAGIEPAPAAYLALTGYKSAALPIELLGRDRCDHAGIQQCAWNPVMSGTMARQVRRIEAASVGWVEPKASPLTAEWLVYPSPIRLV